MTDDKRKEEKERIENLKSRRGKFFISREHLLEKVFPTVFENIYIVRAEYLMMGEGIEYHAYSMMFDKVPLGADCDIYIPIFTYKEGFLEKIEFVNSLYYSLWTDLQAGLITKEKYDELRQAKVQNRLAV